MTKASPYTTPITINCGMLGMREVDVLYEMIKPMPSRDPFQPPEQGGPVIEDVRLFIDGHEVSVKHWLSPTNMSEVVSRVSETWH